MSAGEGIFYGLIFIGLIYLYLQTKDRWNWKKVILWVVGIVFAIIAIFLAYIFIADKLHSGKLIPQSPQVVTSMFDIHLGEKVADAKFRTGGVNKKDDPKSGYVLPSDKSKIFWATDGLVSRIGTWCSDDAMKYPSIDSVEVNGIRCSYTGEQILDRYGKDKIRIACFKNTKGDPEAENARAYDAVNYGVRYVLLTNKVSGIFITQVENLKDLSGENWGECK